MSIIYEPIASKLGEGLTRPTWPESPVLSTFPWKPDELKQLNWSSQPSSYQVRQNLKRYYELMAVIVSDSSQVAIQAAQIELNNLLPSIKEYILTEKDYNLLVDSILTVQRYILQYMNEDLVTKAEILDQHLSSVIQDINNTL